MFLMHYAFERFEVHSALSLPIVSTSANPYNTIKKRNTDTRQRKTIDDDQTAALTDDAAADDTAMNKLFQISS